MYVVKKGKSLSTKKGIVSCPLDSNNPTKKELFNENDLIGGKETLDKLLNSKTIIEFKKEKSKPEKKEEEKDKK